MDAEDQFRERMIENGVSDLTRRQTLVLTLCVAGLSLVDDGPYAFIGNQATSPRTINALLRVCAIRYEQEGTTRYFSVTEIGKEILKRKARTSKGGEVTRCVYCHHTVRNRNGELVCDHSVADALDGGNPVCGSDSSPFKKHKKAPRTEGEK